MLENIKAIAFDIDGTLYPNYQLYFRILPYFLKNIKFFLSYNKTRKVLHRTAPLSDFYEYQARLLSEQIDIPKNEARQKINEIVYDGIKPYFNNVKPFKYIEETFVAFKNAGLKLAILSDFPPEQKGDIWGLAKYCDLILGSEACGALKPSKYPFGILANKLNLSPAEILYVGNSIRSDVLGANAAGMKTAYIMSAMRTIFNKKLPQADISFKNYRQLQKIVLK